MRGYLLDEIETRLCLELQKNRLNCQKALSLANQE